MNDFNYLLDSAITINDVVMHIKNVYLSNNRHLELICDNKISINLPISFLENGGRIQTSGMIIKLENPK